MGISEEFQSTIAPLIAFFIICNILGFFGNIAVLYVYGFRYKKNHYRLLVLVLSVIDMSACCSTVPLETASSWLWFEAPSTGLCKARMFFIMFIGLSALYMLFVTAVYKYRRICRPFGKQVSRKAIKILCLIGVAIALVYGIPAAILFDVNNHNVTLINVTENAFICEVHKSYHGTAYPAAYRHCVSVYSILMVTTIILYIFVARTTIQHVRRMKKAPKIFLPKEESESSFSNFSQTTDTAVSPSENQKDNGTRISQTVCDLEGKPVCFTINPLPLEKVKETQPTSPGKEIEGPTKVAKLQLSSNQIRTVIIMVIIAGTFSVTFLMGLSFGYVFALRTYSDYASIGELVFLFACYRLYFINYALNPVVYFSLDRQFRKEVMKVFYSAKARLINKKT